LLTVFERGGTRFAYNTVRVLAVEDIHRGHARIVGFAQGEY
jgi:hypothetical protein